MGMKIMADKINHETMKKKKKHKRESTNGTDHSLEPNEDMETCDRRSEKILKKKKKRKVDEWLVDAVAPDPVDESATGVSKKKKKKGEDTETTALKCVEREEKKKSKQENSPMVENVAEIHVKIKKKKKKKQKKVEIVENDGVTVTEKKKKTKPAEKEEDEAAAETRNEETDVVEEGKKSKKKRKKDRLKLEDDVVSEIDAPEIVRKRKSSNKEQSQDTNGNTEVEEKKPKKKKANAQEVEPLLVNESLASSAEEKTQKSRKKKASVSQETHLENEQVQSVKKKKKKSEVEVQHSQDRLTDTGDKGVNLGLGQWSTAQFDNSQQRDKFLRLMGGFKSGFQKATTCTDHANMALGAEGQKHLQQGLMGEFERAQSRRMDFSNRGAGLGFSAPTNKKFSIDVNACRSVRFDD